MKNFLFTLTFFALFLQGCFNSKITSTPTHITLSHDDIVITKELETVLRKQLLYPPVSIDIEIKQDKRGNFYTYENAYARSGYEFDYSVGMLVHKIFKKSYSKQILRLGNLYFFIMQTNGKSYYLIAIRNVKSTLELLYPLTKNQIDNLVRRIDPDKTKTIPPLKHPLLVKNADTLPLSNWSAASIVIDTIVKKKGGRVVPR